MVCACSQHPNPPNGQQAQSETLAQKLACWRIVKPPFKKGAYGAVYRSDTYDVVVKIQKLTNPSFAHCARREEFILKELNARRAPHCIKILDSFETPLHSALVLKNGGRNLENLLCELPSERPGGLHLDDLEEISKKCFELLSFMHVHLKRIHGDIKTHNIVMKDSFLFFIDFGLSVRFGTTTTCYTDFCRPPEIVLGMPTHKNSDAWAMGVTLFELATKRPFLLSYDRQNCRACINVSIFRAQMQRLNTLDQPKGAMMETFQKMCKFVGGAEELPDEENIMTSFMGSCGSSEKALALLDLLSNLLKFDPNDRLSCAEALNHKFFHSRFSTDASMQFDFYGDVSGLVMQILNSRDEILFNYPLSEFPSCLHMRKTTDPIFFRCFYTGYPTYFTQSKMPPSIYARRRFCINSGKIRRFISKEIERLNPIQMRYIPFMPHPCVGDVARGFDETSLVSTSRQTQSVISSGPPAEDASVKAIQHKQLSLLEPLKIKRSFPAPRRISPLVTPINKRNCQDLKI